jgi:hypothetical protein
MATIRQDSPSPKRAPSSKCGGCGYPSIEVICPMCKADRRWFGEIFYRADEGLQLQLVETQL